MTETLALITDIEKSIEDTLWTSVTDEDHQRALGKYILAKEQLEKIQNLPSDAERERKRVLSYCLLRINDAMDRLEQSEGSIERTKDSLKLAEESGNRVQILRSKLALGVAYLNQGNLLDAESHFTDIILQTQDETEDEDVIQVYGWTLIVRVNILLGKSLYHQAMELTNHALGVLSGIKNYAGLRTAYSLLSRLYQIEGNTEKANLYKESSEDYAKLAKEYRQ